MVNQPDKFKMVSMTNNKTGEGFIFIPNDDNTIFAVMMPVGDIREWQEKPECINIALDNIMGVEKEYLAEAEKRNVKVIEPEEEQTAVEAQS